MAEFLHLSTAEGLEALDLAANASGRLPHLLEKDVWVVWSLQHLFAGPYANRGMGLDGSRSLARRTSASFKQFAVEAGALD